eukprot:CAMPEP_0116864208 /NCGR_PEP_ID=MMETSP0418-20121206/24687_1 /TAXON_ID=1158023 /ORGANISM="Astrosyne radiata, Strain 13vi08-1A" /LENGTH=378 /DNA_ID=CAMNT_0004499389 /DNA_START=64 /DNA_END=1200 /DNA_ORIENTATION=+
MASNQHYMELRVPTENDVLCGRGRNCFEHEGNKRFRQIVVKNISKYLEAASRKKKTIVVRSIIEQVHGSGGRFLKKNSRGLWYDSGMRGAKEKVGHSLRDASTDRVKCMTEMHKNHLEQSGQKRETVMKSEPQKDLKRKDPPVGGNEGAGKEQRHEHQHIPSTVTSSTAIATQPQTTHTTASTNNTASVSEKVCKEEEDTPKATCLIGDEPRPESVAPTQSPGVKSAATQTSEAKPAAIVVPQIPDESKPETSPPAKKKHRSIPSSIMVPIETAEAPPVQVNVDVPECSNPFDKIITAVNPFDEEQFRMIQQPGLVSLSDDEGVSQAIAEDLHSFSCGTDEWTKAGDKEQKIATSTDDARHDDVSLFALIEQPCSFLS